MYLCYSIVNCNLHCACRFCQPEKQSYYIGRDLTFTGIADANGMISVTEQIAELLAEVFGANFKMKPTRGCRNIKKALPKEKSTLGQVDRQQAIKGMGFGTLTLYNSNPFPITQGLLWSC